MRDLRAPEVLAGAELQRLVQHPEAEALPHVGHAVHQLQPLPLRQPNAVGDLRAGREPDRHRGRVERQRGRLVREVQGREGDGALLNMRDSDSCCWGGGGQWGVFGVGGGFGTRPRYLIVGGGGEWGVFGVGGAMGCVCLGGGGQCVYGIVFWRRCMRQSPWLSLANE